MNLTANYLFELCHSATSPEKNWQLSKTKNNFQQNGPERDWHVITMMMMIIMLILIMIMMMLMIMIMKMISKQITQKEINF